MEDLVKEFKRLGFQIVLSTDESFKIKWKLFELNNIETVSVFHNYQTMEYQWEYFSENSECSNKSLILCQKDKPIMIWSIFEFYKGNRIRLSSNGGNLVLPYFDFQLMEKDVSSILKYILKYLERSDVTFNLLVSKYPMNLFTWAFKLKLNSSVELYQKVDLSQSEQQIFQGIRKSYKSLINQSQRIYKTTVLEKVDDEIWSKFQSFHFHQAGRKTRSDKSWEVQKKHLNDRDAILITCQDENDYVGFAYFNLNKIQATYSVAAYDRNKFDQPIGHGIQWTAIKYFKSEGLKEYIIGTLPECDETDLKLLDIAKFKMGFGETFARVVIKK